MDIQLSRYLYHIKRKFRVIKSSTNKKYKISNYFDIDMWAKFFAITDVLKGYHAAVPKSVKLYYNPSNGLFEPIA